LAETAADQPLTLDEKHHFLLRRLHSLSGIVPIGAFLIEHLLTNSAAFNWFGLFSGGRESFNQKVHWIHNLPFLLVVETLFIFVPLAFHAIYGVKIAMTSEPNTRVYRYGDNWRYSMQRWTGYIAFIFLIVHLLKFRFAHHIGWGEEFIGHEDPFELTRRGFQDFHPWGLHIPAAAVIGFYLVGLFASCFHLGNGIWSFCITWGITIGQRAQDRVKAVGMVVTWVLFIWGCASLYAFVKAKPPAQSETSAARATAGTGVTALVSRSWFDRTIEH
jgi:succinate dehydrogenase / fumarate reductase cytochrome b subunit